MAVVTCVLNRKRISSILYRLTYEKSRARLFLGVRSPTVIDVSRNQLSIALQACLSLARRREKRLPRRETNLTAVPRRAAPVGTKWGWVGAKNGRGTGGEGDERG